jgi:hypothetical protein
MIQPWHDFGPLPVGLQFVFFGLGAITYAKHPEGVLEHQKRRSMAFFQRHLARFQRPEPPDAPADPPSGGTPVGAAVGGVQP